MIYCFDRDAIAVYLDNSATFNVTEYWSTITTMTILLPGRLHGLGANTFVGVDIYNSNVI